MKLVHLSDLHLGFRAYETTERGWNQRERDVAGAFRRALQATIRLRPDLILVTGDVFDGPDPPSTAFLTFARGISHLRSNLPGAPILVIAGAHDSPRSLSNPGPVGVLDALPMVDAAASAPRSIRFRQTGLRALLVPHRASAAPPYPEVVPDGTARWNVLLVRGLPEAGPDPSARGLSIDPSEWSYVAIGGAHRHRRWAPNAWTAGALERPSIAPWPEATDERGFVLFDLAKGEGEFHAIPGRPVVDLAPVRVDPDDIEGGTRRLRDLVQGLPGGVEGRILRVRLRGEISDPSVGVAPGLLDALRRSASHLSIRLEPLRSQPDPSGEGWHPHRLTAGLDARERTAVPLVASGLVLVSSESESLLARIEDDLRSTLAEANPLLAVEPAPPGGSAIGPIWEGGRTPESAIEFVVEATGSRTGPKEARGSRPEATDRVAVVEARLTELRASSIEASGDLEAAMLDWARERQDAESKLEIYRERAREIRDRIREIESEGAAAPCPTCGRPLGESAESLLDDLRGEWEGLVQDGRWWRRRREQLDSKSDELREMEEQVLRLHAAVEETAEEAERVRGERGRKGAVGSLEEGGMYPESRRHPGLETPEAREILRAAGDTIFRLTLGRISGVRAESGEVKVTNLAGRVRSAEGTDEAALALAVQIACWKFARSRHVDIASLLVSGLWKKGDTGLARAALEVLKELSAEGAAVLLIGPPRFRDLRPDAFDQVLELTEGAGGAVDVRVGPTGDPPISLKLRDPAATTA